MSELFDDSGSDGPAGNAPEFSVSEISGAIKRVIEGEFAHVRVRGEIGRVSRPASGHIYLDLKDDRSVLASVCWKGVARGLATPPEEGLEVVATGRLTTFGGQSRYQLVIESMAPAGVGALMAMLEKRRKALAAEGLFDADRKQPLPYLPRTIGVITSPSGAVIRDILHRLRDRCPTEVIVWPVVVQGEQCGPQVSAAIAGFNALDPGGPTPRPDVLIVARGGGSVEDLWGFNDEAVVRAAAASTIPLISAVGHETDTTLIDHAADIRAPTPTAAAELAVPVRADLLAALAGYEERRSRAGARMIAERRQRLRDLGRLLPRPQAIAAERAQKLDELTYRLGFALGGRAQRARGDLMRSPAWRFGPALLTQFGTRRRERLAALATRLRADTLTRREKGDRERLGAVVQRATRAVAQALKAPQWRLGQATRLLTGLSHDATLKRGFAILRNKEGTLLANVSSLRDAVDFSVELQDGRLDAATRTGAKSGPVSGSAPAQRRAPKNEDQGNLF